MLESWQVTSYDPPKEQYFNPSMPNKQYKTNIAYQNQPTQKDYQDYLWVFGGYKR
jgi:hypothetical protein